MVTKLERENNTIFYLHNAWANSPDGTAGFTLEETEDAAYIGNCISMSSAEVLNPSSYNWIAVEFEAVEESDTAELTELGEDVPEDPEDEDDDYSYEDYMDGAVQAAADTATTAQESADIAQQKAEEATASAALAQQKAEEATASAAEAKTAADTAREKAEAATTDAATAKQKAEEATSSAALAQQKAESATAAAGAAHTAAESATSDARAAGIAAATAQAAAEAAQGDIDDQKKYFYHDKLGAHVLDAAGGAYRTDIKSDGVQIVQTATETPIAKYGEAIQIGSKSGNRMIISAEDFKIQNEASDIFDITIDKNLSSLKIQFNKWDGKEAEQQVAAGNIYKKTIVLDEAFNSIESICTVAKNDEGSWDYWFSENEGPYYFTTSGNNSITIVIDGTNTEAQAANWSFQEELRISYYSKETYSSTVGCNNLFASEKISATTMRVADVVRARRVECDSIDAGWLTANIESGTGIARATTGSVTMQPKWWRFGSLVQMEFRVAATGAVNPGKNLATGTIQKIPRPITSTGVRAVSYYGNNANVSFISQDGNFTVRNCGNDALAKGNDAIGIFTYITDGSILGR